MTRPRDIMEKEHRFLSSRLFQKHKQVEVVLNSSVLAWKEIEESRKRSSGISNTSDTARNHAVQVCEILTVRKTTEDDQDNTETRRSQKKVKQQSQLYPHAFTVSYVRKRRQHQWRCSNVTFHCANQGLCEQWIQLINEQLSLLTNRPKSLLVYINPLGGKRRGKRIYEHKVAPLFSRACISADVIVTERANHARDHLKTEANLDKYDGVVCVGGDGMFSEIMHALVTRTQTDNGVDQTQPDAELVPCRLRIGIIPAGSTDCICFATVGTSDPVTSALHIIVGDCQPMDVCSVHHDDTFLRYSVSLLGYGFYGDVQTDSEAKRWLGPARYDLSGVKTFLSHNYYEGTISFLPRRTIWETPGTSYSVDPGATSVSTSPHHRTSNGRRRRRRRSLMKERLECDPWKVYRHKCSQYELCVSTKSQGLSPSAHLADGTTDLILVRKCSRLNFFRHLLRHTNKDDQFDHWFVEVHRVKKFRFQPWHSKPDSLEDLSESLQKTGFSPICSASTTYNYSPALSSWTCDGEPLPHAAIQVSVQCQLIRLFARGIEEQQQQ